MNQIDCSMVLAEECQSGCPRPNEEEDGAGKHATWADFTVLKRADDLGGQVVRTGFLWMGVLQIEHRLKFSPFPHHMLKILSFG
jgi:hypothetical protein